TGANTMSDPFNNDSLHSGTSDDYTGGHSSDLGYNQHDNLNSNHQWQDLSQQNQDYQGGWGLPEDNFYHHSHHSEISSLADLPESEPLPTFDSHHSLGDNDVNSYYHQPNGEYSLSSDNYDELPQLDRHTAFASHRLNYSDDSVYTTINNHGMIYKHTDCYHSDWVGTIDGRKVYNTNHHYLGYAGTDGNIYDNHSHRVGWVDRCGHVFNTSGVEVYETTKGVVGGTAYMLLVYLGGVN
ncbi:MAG: hypothetical protein SXA11_10060, partial [Cyanobacteriota bacterium]|nr:hypothetical protein [Cyanobacteriota bacterium]